MKALISPQELVTDINGNVGCRVAQVDELGFEIAKPLFWIGCPDNCVADEWYYIEQQVLPLPQPTEIIEDNTITE
jgi:hypothetical protein